ncbi:hypothetical protein BGZ63DRAFT_230622 [Mariannaea sp. PMI_226]|nr:hypothetical protein BGZ63DRAFT_230622 [Mariannaea sp. PMI_226]
MPRMIRHSNLSPLLFLLSIFSQHPLSATALRASPNSPCASFCADSDSNSTDSATFTTTGDDIVCLDQSFNSKPEGQQFQRCLACLEGSDYVHGDQNDQDWYLYNLRYAFDYCIFGYPNASHIDSSPCVTSEACGPLENALKTSITTPNDRTQYDYCDADKKVMLTDYYSSCYSCVRAGGSHNYVSNFLVALEAGCQQKPTAGTPVSLNGTVFTDAPIQPSGPSSTSSPSNSSLSSGGIAGIAIGILLVLLFLTGCVFVQYRKRRNRSRARVRARLARPQPFAFYQQERARESEFSDISRGDYYQDALTTPPVGGRGMASPCSSISVSPVEVTKQPGSRPTSLSMAVPWPPPIHPSPRVDTFSEALPTPPSTSTSIRSNLISPLFSPGFGVASPRIISPRWSRDARPNEGEAQRMNKELKKNSWGAVAPTESRNIQIKFDPPPKRAKK